MFDKIALFFHKCWLSYNYRWCKVEAYLAYNRGEYMTKAQWEATADEWQRKYIMAGRTLRHG